MDMIKILEEREEAIRADIDTATSRLAEFRQAIEEQGTTVTGSRGQLRPHPLLAAERETKRELERKRDELEDVVYRLDNARLTEQANSIWRSSAARG